MKLTRSIVDPKLQDLGRTPGVYTIWDKVRGVMLYAGESGDLARRIRQLWRTQNHTFARCYASGLGFGKITKKTPPAKRRRVEQAMEDAYGYRLQIAWSKINFGRKELEAALLKWAKCPAGSHDGDLD